MKLGFKKTLGAMAAVVGLAMGPQVEAAVKVGFVYVGPVGDFGWTYRHDLGRKAIEKKFGDQVETTFVESVKEGPDAQRVIRKLAASGHDLIFTTSFGFMNPTLKVAKQFKKVKFEHATGYKRAKNVSTYAARFYEGRYVVGTIAGRMTKSNVIGYVASFPIPEVVRGINAVARSARAVNPDATVKVVWVNSWYDPGKEADAAKTLTDQGADIILQHTDSPAPLQVAEQRWIWGVGQASDMASFAPKSQLTAIIDNWDQYYIDRVQAVMDGTWSSEDTWGGIKSGMVAFAPFHKEIPADVMAEAEKIKQEIADGALHPFQGPVIKQNGEEVIPAGEVLDDGALAGMNYYVEGVEGQLPQ
ncbi:BMP family ABC transporter substrate-binding protein [Motiliproteus sp. MSK22-1]|uniref:BMP family ABC transporter substrate-binding protein n=1 Tax=Motiliproteus sp. MSK22-1 TaxID=1897630 RepID=UPI00097596B8|nr:BMP family ABC transporter substrate-binding protein [Motiliproteus sp. MSK22-1]OMH28451.1 BMP family ABC transporter substrate-binding protein [Motiliproteus sp. MSK22-1]